MMISQMSVFSEFEQIDLFQCQNLNKIPYSFEKSCFSHKLFVTLSVVAVSRQKGRSGVN